MSKIAKKKNNGINGSILQGRFSWFRLLMKEKGDVEKSQKLGSDSIGSVGINISIGFFNIVSWTQPTRLAVFSPPKESSSDR